MKNKIKKILWATMMAAALTACSSSKGADPVQSEVVTINGESPEVYFKRFQYKVTGNCNDRSGLNFHFLSTFEEHLSLPDDPNGRKRSMIVDVFLNSDGSYKARYTKMVFLGMTDFGSSRYSNESEDWLNGKAVLNQSGELILQGLGKLSAISYNDRPSAMLSVENKSLSERETDLMAVMSYVESTAGLEGSENTCPKL